MDERINKVMDRLRALCSRREYCTRDIMKKALDALDGDTVLVSPIKQRNRTSGGHSDEGKIIKIVARGIKTLAGTLLMGGGRKKTLRSDT